VHGPGRGSRVRGLRGVQGGRPRRPGPGDRARNDPLAGFGRGARRLAWARPADVGARHGGDPGGCPAGWTRMVTVGVLALQGDFAAHRRALARLGAATVAVRKPAHLSAAEALVLPGGESTAVLRGIERDRLEEPLAAFLCSGRPVLGTCAGAILLARRVLNPPQRSFRALDIDVERNAYGTQLDSFAATLDAAGPLAGTLGVFIRAPRIR